MIVAACAPPASTATSAATSAEGAAAPPLATVESLPRGERMVVQLDRAIGTDTVRPGERVTARVVNPKLPAEARVVLQVSESVRGDQKTAPELALRVVQLRADGCSTPLPARVSSAELKYVSQPPGHAERSAAVASAVMGGLMLGMTGFVTGFGLGLTGGAVHEARILAVDAFLPANALLTLELQAPLDLRHCQWRARRSTPPAPPM